MRRWNAHLGVVALATATLLGAAGIRAAPRIAVGKSPVALAVDAATKTLYVANSGSGTISVIAASRCNGLTTSDCAPVAVSAVGPAPVAVAADERADTVYVADASGTLSVIDGGGCNARTTTRCRPVASFAIGSGLSALAVDQRTHTLYVVNGARDTVAVLNTRSCDGATTSGCRLLASAPVGRGPAGLAVDERTDTVYVSNSGSGTISVIDGATCDAATTRDCRPVATAHTASGPDGIAVDAATDTVYVADRTSSGDGGEDYSDAEVSTGLVSVFNGARCDATRTSGCSPVADAAVGTTPVEVAVDTATNTVYVTNRTDAGGPDVSVIDGATCNATRSSGCLATWSIPVADKPEGLAVLPSSPSVSGVVYVADTGAGSVSVLGDPGQPHTVAAAPVGPGAVEVSWKPAAGPDLSINTLGAGATPGQFTYHIVPSPGCPTCTGLEVTQPVSSSGRLVADLGSVVTGLHSGKRYTFAVYATNEAGPGPISTPSSALLVNSLQMRPPRLGLVAGKRYSERLTVRGGRVSTWRVVAGRLPAGLHLSRAGLLAGVPRTAGTREVTLKAAAAGRRVLETTAAYSFTVSSSLRPGAPRKTPAPPGRVTVTRVSDGQVGLTWKATSSWGSSAAKGYVVTASRPGTDGTVTTTAPASATSANVANLYDGLPVSFTVAAENAAGNLSAPSLPSANVTPTATTGLSSTLRFTTSPQESGCEQGYLACFNFQQNFFVNAENAGPGAVPIVWGQNVLVFYEENFQWYVQSEAQVWVESSSEYGVFWYGPPDWYDTTRKVGAYPATFKVTTAVEKDKIVFSNSLEGNDYWSWRAPSLDKANPFDVVEAAAPTRYGEFFDPQGVLVGDASGSQSSFEQPTAGSLISAGDLAAGPAETGFDCPISSAASSTGETSSGLDFFPRGSAAQFSYRKHASEVGVAFGPDSYSCPGSAAPDEPGRIPVSALARAAGIGSASRTGTTRSLLVQQPRGSTRGGGASSP